VGELELDERHCLAISSAIYGGAQPCRIDLIRPHTAVKDSSALYLVDDAYILHIAPAAFPDAARTEADAIRAMRARLGAYGHVLPPLAAEGVIEGRSFMAVPRLRPLGDTRLLGMIDRWRVRGAALGWVRGLATLAEPPSDAAAARFTACLAALTEMPDLADEIVSAAGTGLAALECGSIAVGHVPMHGDLWLGNLLRRPGGGLCVIDWGGSQQHGYGVYDLVRLGASLRAPLRIAKRELAAHEARLGGPEATRIHLLGALGHYAMNLGQFPRERFIAMAGQVWRQFLAWH
jgi:hypothetical protein